MLEQRLPGFTDVPEPTPQDLAREKKEQEAIERHRRHEEECRFLATRGRRYRDCRLSTFRWHGDPDEQQQQQAAVRTLTNYATNMKAAVEAGSGLLLSGPVGTGKDHFLVALARVAIVRYGYLIAWTTGMDLYGRFRDQISAGVAERELLNKYTDKDILIISDPLPPWGDLTDYQASTLYRIIDARYNECKPTWCSINCGDPKDAEKRIGAATIDRLRDGAVAVGCNWGSHRQTQATCSN